MVFDNFYIASPSLHMFNASNTRRLFSSLVSKANKLPGFRKVFGKHQMSRVSFVINSNSYYAESRSTYNKRIFDGQFLGEYVYLPTVNNSGDLCKYDAFVLNVNNRFVFFPYKYAMNIIRMLSVRCLQGYICIESASFLTAYDIFLNSLKK